MFSTGYHELLAGLDDLPPPKNRDLIRAQNRPNATSARSATGYNSTLSTTMPSSRSKDLPSAGSARSARSVRSTGGNSQRSLQKAW